MSACDRDFLKIVNAIRVARDAVTVYLSWSGHATLCAGVGGVRVGTYTKAVSIAQLEDDLREAERERRGRVG